MKILKGLFLIFMGIMITIFLESCSNDDSEPILTLEYHLQKGLLNNVTGIVEEEARTVWLSSSDGEPITEPIIAPAGETVSILIPNGANEFTVHEIIQYNYEGSVFTILYSTANVTPGAFVRKELNNNFRRGEETGNVTFRAINAPDNSTVTFSAAGYHSSNRWSSNDETFELPLYEHANYAFILLSETAASTTNQKIFFFNELNDGDVVDVDFNNEGIEFDTYDYSNVDIEDFTFKTFTANAYEQSNIYLDGEMRIPSGTNIYYVPKNVDGLNDYAFSYTASHDDGKFYAMEYFGDPLNPETLVLPNMDISVSNSDIENLVVNITGDCSYFDYRTIQGQFGDPIINLWLSLSEDPESLAFPILPEEVKDIFTITGIESFSGTSTVYQSVFFDHLSYSGFLDRHHGRVDQEVFNGIDKFRGNVRIIE